MNSKHVLLTMTMNR